MSVHSETQKYTRKPAFSTDPNTAMLEMMHTIDTLRGVYVRETEALDKADTQSFLALQEQKLDAARHYQHGVEEFLKRSEEMRSVNPLAKKRLKDMQEEFSTLAIKNMDALSRMQRTIERLGNTLRSAARDAAKKQRALSYGETGKITDDSRRTVSMGVSETA
jgi:hypothetical protein